MRATWESGQKVIKCIGFDATEDHRTYADGGKLDICPEKGLPDYGDRYETTYPLREWGLSRIDCIRIITAAGLPVPPKSACFFCPSMKDAEILELMRDHPDLYRLAIEMERLYRAGHHFRGDDVFTVKAVHRLTGEKEVLELQGDTVASIRQQFRQRFDDTARPYKYKISASKAVAGLSRGEAWVHKRLSLPTI